MGRVLTNATSFAWAAEVLNQPGQLPAQPVWTQVQPNNVPTFGPNVTSVARRPITKDRQARKGTQTDLDSAVEIEHDLIWDTFLDLSQRFVFARAKNLDLRFTSSAATLTSQYVIPALNASQAGRLVYQEDTGTPVLVSILMGSGWELDSNNGIKTLAAQPADTETFLAVAETLEDETGGTGTRIENAGVRSLAGATDLTWTFSAGSNTALLTSAGDVADWSAYGFQIGQQIHVGTPDGSGGMTNGFDNAGTPMVGYGRIISIAGSNMTLDSLSPALKFTDADAPATDVDILSGVYIRNVRTDDADFLGESIQWEAAWDNLADPGPGDEYEYALGNFANALTINIPLTDKATFTMGFIGTDTEPPTGTRKQNADSPIFPERDVALNTSQDIAVLSVVKTDVDETLSVFFKNLTLNIGNNVSPEKIVGKLGAMFMNLGDFDVGLEGQALFTDGGLIAAIRNNDTIALKSALSNDDGTLVIDFPAMTLSGGDRELPLNETVRVNFTGTAFKDPTLETSIGLTFIPIDLTTNPTN